MRIMRTVVAVGAAVGLAVFAAVALAHHMTGGQATCTGVTASFAGFNDSNKPIGYVVKVDGTAVPVSPASPYTFEGSDATLALTFSSALAAGDHTVFFEASWPGQDSAAQFEQVVHGCAGPPPPPAPPAPPAAPQPPPAATPPAATPPTATPPAAAPRPKHRRFGTPGSPRKRCVHGRKHLRDSHGRRFTVCRSKPQAKKPSRSIHPNFTG